MNKEYKPIACGLHDELELRALRKKSISLVYKDDNHVLKTIDCIIIDLFSKDKVEYLKTDVGLVIRLDDMVEVDNVIFNKIF